MRYALAVLFFFIPLTMHAQDVNRYISLESVMKGLYPVASGKCDLELANLKLDKEPCDFARREGDDEHLYVLMPDENGMPKLILEASMSESEPSWKVIYRKGQQWI